MTLLALQRDEGLLGVGEVEGEEEEEDDREEDRDSEDEGRCFIVILFSRGLRSLGRGWFSL